jgi:hypothetical protein
VNEDPFTVMAEGRRRDRLPVLIEALDKLSRIGAVQQACSIFQYSENPFLVRAEGREGDRLT